MPGLTFLCDRKTGFFTIFYNLGRKCDTVTDLEKYEQDEAFSSLKEWWSISKQSVVLGGMIFVYL